MNDNIGDTIPVDQFLGHMLTEFQKPEILPCTNRSKYNAIHECAALGLSPRLGQVVLIPYKNNQDRTVEVKVTPQWQGYKAVMERHPKIEEVAATLVHINDTFSYENGLIHHAFDPLDPKRKIESAKDLRGGYCNLDLFGELSNLTRC